MALRIVSWNVNSLRSALEKGWTYRVLTLRPMATNNFGNGEGGNGSVVAIVAIIVLIAVGALFVIYAIPALQNATQAPEKQDIEIKLPDNIIPDKDVSAEGEADTTTP